MEILLMLFMLIMPVVLLLCGIIMGVAGRPQKYKWWAGYRTSRAIKNQETWVFANRYFGKLSLLSGLTTLTFSIGVINTQDVYVMAWTYAAQVISFILVCILTETALKKEFDKNGERR